MAYRGAGRPEATFVLERIVDVAASEMGIDRVELRRRNMIPKEAYPYQTPVLVQYDSGDPVGCLDGALAEFESGLGEHWRDTVVVVATEFGRTARINGTDGTDHGTATVTLLAGGALRGGRVVADWPGLKDAALYQQRDLKPTADLRAVLVDITPRGRSVHGESLANRRAALAAMLSQLPEADLNTLMKALAPLERLGAGVDELDATHLLASA